MYGKIKRLFPYWDIPASDELNGHVLKIAVDAARFFIEEVQLLQEILPFDEETKQMEMPQQSRDLRFISN
ncbi:hypothetical protein N7526_011443 [Penicillium atrosanguineum]|nr:hypothetical protein N7526_011443 [Penicillium atrosanguineum]